MKNASEFSSPLRFLLTDIDDTLTDEGHLGPEAYQALWNLHNAGIHVIPVTGRPAGWCEMIARVWPVSGIVGENGGFYFRYHNKTMHRHFFFDEKIQKENRTKLQQLEKEILQKVPGSALASDQFCRLMDLAIDFCEDVPALPKTEVQKIVDLFHAVGAQAKVSSIHVNGWFGSYDKLTMSLRFLEKEFGVSAEEAKKVCAFSGDSPNDEPMFAYFPHSFAVANIQNFIDQIKNKPTYVSKDRGGLGFTEIAKAILKSHTKA
ncbi:HAD family hydrolase [Bdellovibrio bacteriovorus]|uniref:Putative hydrolase n=1 Tax=Bdellovibrio bacteriovorus str. Tiberius TaxID=1069642 RepID=K7YLG6_BDEBC|nr:HAD-IIB family hydrolase [Bdellovibrio bacteriovorus]AFY00611.1 putative hydrolase [Bdellovibrio bacteriovorus str. Tiberius]